jgi:hypothetical protein
VAKASDCKSDIVGSTPTDASPAAAFSRSPKDDLSAAFLLVPAHRGKSARVASGVTIRMDGVPCSRLLGVSMIHVFKHAYASSPRKHATHLFDRDRGLA